jgi:Raf kinase inhibitor-like YbhB/YbcL family protein
MYAESALRFGLRRLAAASSIGVFLSLADCRAAAHQVEDPMAATTLNITSPSFGPNGPIPTRHTCEGQDISPALSWSAGPSGTKCFAVIVDDPDAPDPKAPKTTWVHWVVYNIPASVNELAEGAATAGLPAGALSGKNDWKRTGYGGPCPPIGRHRYFHKVYALDVVLPDLHAPDKASLLEAMRGHVLAEGQVVGTYQKTK